VTALCHFTFTNEVFGGANIDYLRPMTALTMTMTASELLEQMGHRSSRGQGNT
jgi:hypothetical protein